MNKKKFITLLSLIFVMLYAIAGCNFSSPMLDHGNIPTKASVPNVKQENAQLTISAAASLKEALSEITPLFNKVSNAKSHIAIRNNF